MWPYEFVLPELGFLWAEVFVPSVHSSLVTLVQGTFQRTTNRRLTMFDDVLTHNISEGVSWVRPTSIAKRPERNTVLTIKPKLDFLFDETTDFSGYSPCGNDGLWSVQCLQRLSPFFQSCHHPLFSTHSYTVDGTLSWPIDYCQGTI